MERWAKQREVIRGQIEKIQHELIGVLGEEQVKAIFQAQIASLAETARVLTFEASRKIELAMITTGSDITHTKNQRKLANAYGALDQEGQEAHFFDEKK